MIVRTGLEIIGRSLPRRLRGIRAGLLVHPASVNNRLMHAIDIFLKLKQIELKALFGPQHGIFGETQDNMIEWKGFRDKKTGIMVYSLYGDVRIPERDMLRDIDAMFIDLQDVGSRYYTYIWTMALCMKRCEEMNKAVIVLDRPNPIGGEMIEGPVLDTKYSSFVGLFPLPVRHGMTIAEIALYLKDRFYPSLDLYVIRMEGWSRSMWFDMTGLPWVMPSPNMPTLTTATVYPGMCLLEGTNISEGRGTTMPFEFFGAPFIEPEMVVKRLKEHRLKGVIFRHVYFIPTFQKYAGRMCGGAQLHITDRGIFKPFKTAVAIIKTIHELYPYRFGWREPPYEYETVKLPIDILAGTNRLRMDIEDGLSLKEMEERWMDDCKRFDKDIRQNYLLYS
ncbi:MAG: DUF1343 domain-containing protein [Thermodesulfovibrionia bacterium]